MSAPDDAGAAPDLAAMVSTIADGQPPTTLEHAALRLKLIDTALERGIPWSAIGAALGGISGREAKRDAHRLRAQVKRAALAHGRSPFRGPATRHKRAATR